MPQFSVIVPVYNRPAEVEDLLASLAEQTYRDFETIIVEDGSTLPCGYICDAYAGRLDLHYYPKSNEGRSIARNYGIERARGRMLVFFDSDCVIPPDYFEILSQSLAEKPVDCFGGPDAAHESFSPTQKAINFAMTSFLTTGGIRGGRHSMEKFVPRSFNMGYTREVYDKVGGFREMFSEDIDMSTRIRQAGFSTALIPDAKVYHKRRVDFAKFWRQVHVFGMSRITLKELYPGSLKIVHTLPCRSHCNRARASASRHIRQPLVAPSDRNLYRGIVCRRIVFDRIPRSRLPCHSCRRHTDLRLRNGIHPRLYQQYSVAPRP